jgi:hypothetical protein
MQEFLMIAVVMSIVLLALWLWDEHSRRVERHRRHLENRERQGRTTARLALSL